MRILILFWLAVCGSEWALGQAKPVSPAALQATVDTSYPAVTGTHIAVHAGDDLQAAYNAAVCGDELVLDAGATFTGNFVFNKQCSASNWLIVRTANLTQLPATGTRVGPGDAVNMPKIISKTCFQNSADGRRF